MSSENDRSRREQRFRNQYQDLYRSTLTSDPLLARIYAMFANQGQGFNPLEMFQQGVQDINAGTQVRQRDTNQQMAQMGLGSQQYGFATSAIERARQTQVQALQGLIDQQQFQSQPTELFESVSGQAGTTLNALGSEYG